jgi:hypothetical protein
MHPAVADAGEGCDLAHDHPEEVAVEHEIVTLLQEYKDNVGNLRSQEGRR